MDKHIETLRRTIRNKDFRKVFSNFFYLAVLNVTNFLLPIITFPYLVLTLGAEKFGLLAFITSIITYLLVFTDYGFNLSATRHISLYRDNDKKINEIVSAVYIIKLALVTLSAIVLLLLVTVVPKFQDYYILYFYTFGIVIGQSLFPMWFFQGIEKMGLISILNIISKIIFTVCVFLFVKKESDFSLVPIFTSLGYILVGLAAIVLLLTRYGVKLQRVSITKIVFYLRDGWHLFISNISVTLYTTAIITILGFYTSNTIVGYYSFADKIIQIIRGMLAPLSQALFPFLVKEYRTDPNRVLLINRKLLKYGSLVFLPLCGAIYFFAPDIVFLLFKKENQEPIHILRIFTIIPFLIFLANIFALFTMIVFNKNKEYSKIIISAGVLNIILSFIFIPTFEHIGAAFCVLFIEVYVTLRYIHYTQTHGMRLFN